MLTPQQKIENEKHHKILISFRQSAALYWENIFGDFCCGIFLCECCQSNPKRSKLAKLYDTCQDKIDAELDVVKIIKNLKKLRIITKNHILNDPAMRHEIEHDEKNLINLDSDDFVDTCSKAPDLKGPTMSGIKRSLS